MMKLSQLTQQAIEAAKEQNWPSAVELNQLIIDQVPTDLAALNRLGLALLQTKQAEKAKKIFEQVVALDKSNIIAHKHLKRLQTSSAPLKSPFANQYFIEEPGKTKIVDLHRLAAKNTLLGLAVGQPCKLIPKNHFISIDTESGVHIGSLPEDISFRLAKLISKGNEYSCVVHSCSEKTCAVLIRETKQSDQNQHCLSFPVNKSALANANQMDDFILEDEVPVLTEEGEVDPTVIETALDRVDDFE